MAKDDKKTKYQVKNDYYEPSLRHMVYRGDEIELTEAEAREVPRHLLLDAAVAKAAGKAKVEKKGGPQSDLPKIFEDLYEGVPTKSQLKTTTNEDLQKVADALGVEIPEDAVKADMVKAIEGQLER